MKTKVKNKIESQKKKLSEDTFNESERKSKWNNGLRD